ncbi:hypothetical protein MWU78_12910 [Arenibacter sp. F26102]|uniref:hypothetical protein n=1 Tax=Arenibacter sp. F26102 TaxID=2926416 RepID=UPI001FF3CAB4|nr:hypothetical protein [Arenibacter sp. F26102]MCK0146548.1 hypothetical protein [Arenibacter sp. F26102]
MLNTFGGTLENIPATVILNFVGLWVSVDLGAEVGIAVGYLTLGFTLNLYVYFNNALETYYYAFLVCTDHLSVYGEERKWN